MPQVNAALQVPSSRLCRCCLYGLSKLSLPSSEYSPLLAVNVQDLHGAETSGAMQVALAFPAVPAQELVPVGPVLFPIMAALVKQGSRTLVSRLSSQTITMVFCLVEAIPGFWLLRSCCILPLCLMNVSGMNDGL